MDTDRLSPGHRLKQDQDVMLDISPEVEEWMRTDGRLVLVVDVGMAGFEVPQGRPDASLKELTQPKPARTAAQQGGRS
ncbi:growth/differentiation factor 8 isoform X1 [Lates japonicus]|uniref:Growth/differentiation factor 8 isoform X1 n=1 Tax=Lates japonicus TaxID=270547 RepID=A0AAD3RL54_LATJO|nr:growth/differentiation factor 8 isoform X1 [Lates japonicus]